MSYTYDAVGNRLTQTTASEMLWRMGITTAIGLLAIREGSEAGVVVKTFGYDDEGNMTERRNGSGGLIQSYRTDPKGRMIQMTGSHGTFAYTYDPFDYRIHKQGPGVSAGYLLEGGHVETVTGSLNPRSSFEEWSLMRSSTCINMIQTAHGRTTRIRMIPCSRSSASRGMRAARFKRLNMGRLAKRLGVLESVVQCSNFFSYLNGYTTVSVQIHVQ